MNPKSLVIELSKVKDFENPKLTLEQYTTGAANTAHIISAINVCLLGDF